MPMKKSRAISICGADVWRLCAISLVSVNGETYSVVPSTLPLTKYSMAHPWVAGSHARVTSTEAVFHQPPVGSSSCAVDGGVENEATIRVACCAWAGASGMTMANRRSASKARARRRRSAAH
jgi:hypothetical protein